MQVVADYNMGSMPELDLSGLITDLSVMRFERGLARSDKYRP